MASAPYQADLDRYRAAFDEAVRGAGQALQAVLDRGYRFGLLLAPGMTGSDFDALDAPGAKAELQRIVVTWGRSEMAEDDTLILSWDFSSHVEKLLDELNQSEGERDTRLEPLLGAPDEEVPGVRWVSEAGELHDGSDIERFPRMDDTFTDGVLAALRDVRDEALRRIHTTGGAQ